ncbi:MAG: alkaline phosphatase family protein [Acidobacteria bacterium]|nr:alkaline phosphatase family protein [Acidobacteriota bacterium]
MRWLPVLAGLLAATVTGSCGGGPGSPAPSGQKLLVIGLAGADWGRVRTLMEQRRLPHLSALVERGASGRVLPSEPPLPPLLWTTLATGRPPDEHGILDFVESDGDGGYQPVSGRGRRVKALWNMADEAGLTTVCVGWWTTWPAEEIRGAMVSDRWVAGTPVATGWPTPALVGDSGPRDLVSPATLQAQVDPLRLDSLDVGEREMARFLPLDGEARQVLAGRRAADTHGEEHPIALLRRVVAATSSVEAATLDLMRDRSPDLTLVYFAGLDEVGHLFARFESPAMSGVSAGQRRRYGGVMDAFYRYQDEVIGRLVVAAGPETAVVLVSTHGFARGGQRPGSEPAGAAGQSALWHTGPGLLIFSGGPFSSGSLGDVRLVDVAPTLLVTLGLPVAEDLAGSPLRAVLSGEFLLEHPVRVIASHERVGQQRPSSPETRTPGALLNLATIFAARGDVWGARKSYEAAIAAAPASVLARAGLFDHLRVTAPPREALAAGTELLAQIPRAPTQTYSQVARLWVETGEIAQGRDFLERYPGEPGMPGPWLARAILDEAEGDDDSALAALEKALARDPGSWDVAQALVAFHERRQQLNAVVPALRHGLAARGGDSLPHLVALGYVVLQEGDLEAAGDYLGRAVEIAPEQEEALLYLGSVHYRSHRYGEAAATWSRLVEVAPDHEDGRANLILALSRAGRIAQALAAFREAGPTGRNSPRLLYAAAYGCLLNGLAQEGLPLARRSLELAPDQEETRELVRSLEAGAMTAAEEAP